MDRLTVRPTRLLAAAAVAALLALVSTFAASGASAKAATAGVTLKAGVFSWTAAAIETDILADIAHAHPDLGVAKITTTNIDPAPGWIGLQRGNLDFLTEVNLPNQQSFANEAKATTKIVSETYGGATQGWFVPAYAVAPGGALHGLTSISQLSDSSWAAKVGGTLYDDDPGWVTTEENTDRIKAFGLKRKHVESSDAALVAQVTRAYEQKKPILFYFYHPHWLFTKFKLVQLSEPKPFTSKCFTAGGPDNCAIPTLSAWVAENDGLAKKAPKFAALLKKFKVSLNDLQTLLEQNEAKNLSPAKLAQKWVDANKAEINTWLT